jgi:hypothetical protein
MRRNCKNVATVSPALRCKDALGGNIMWALGVPLCQDHTADAVVETVLAEPAWSKLCGMIRKEGYAPPEKGTRFDFVPLSKFSLLQQASIDEAARVGA